MAQTELPKIELVRKYTFFETESVKQLDCLDFDLSSENPIRLNFDNCILVLFYSENKESQDLAIIWALAAREVSGPIFAALNILKEKKVADAFSRVAANRNHPLFPFRLRQIPYILVYRNSWPVAFYEGPRSVQAISNFALVLACNATYTNSNQEAAGTSLENYLIPGIELFKSNTPENLLMKSTETSENIRGYNPEIGIVKADTEKAKAAAEKEKEFKERLRKIFEEPTKSS
jgi:hypothetical protein